VTAPILVAANQQADIFCLVVSRPSVGSAYGEILFNLA
jgi:hypothetical protein